MKHGLIDKAILKINPNAEFSINGDDLEQITWHNDTTPISKSDIQAQISTVELEFAMEELRRIRNRLLRDTDFYALGDVTMSDDMKTYRQKLRDITKGLTTVDEVNAVSWPTKP